MALVNYAEIAGTNDFTFKLVMEGITSVLENAISANKKKQGSITDQIAFLESPDASTNMGVNRADVKTEDAQDSLGEMQEICNILEKLKAEQIKAFTEKCGVPHYTWNRGLSIEENVRKKKAVQSIKVTK